MPFRIPRFLYLFDCLFVFCGWQDIPDVLRARDDNSGFMSTRQALYQTTPTFQKFLIACLELTFYILSVSDLSKRGNWGTKQESNVSLRVNWVHAIKYSISSPCGLQEMARRSNSQKRRTGRWPQSPRKSRRDSPGIFNPKILHRDGKQRQNYPLCLTYIIKRKISKRLCVQTPDQHT